MNNYTLKAVFGQLFYLIKRRCYTLVSLGALIMTTTTQSEVQFQVIFAVPKPNTNLEMISTPEILFAQNISDAEQKVRSLSQYKDYGLFQILDKNGLVLKMAAPE